MEQSVDPNIIRSGIKEMLSCRSVARVFTDKIAEFEELYQDSLNHLQYLSARRRQATSQEQLEWEDWAKKREEARRDKIKTSCVRFSIYRDQCLGRPVPVGLNIEQAKSVLLPDVIGVSQRVAERNICCPVHKEKTPSFKWYKKSNKGICFGCGWRGDSIDMYMELNGCDFKTAVSALNKM